MSFWRVRPSFPLNRFDGRSVAILRSRALDILLPRADLVDAESALFFSRRGAPVRAAPAEGGVVQGGVMDSGAAAFAPAPPAVGVAVVTSAGCTGWRGRSGRTEFFARERLGTSRWVPVPWARDLGTTAARAGGAAARDYSLQARFP